ncbi:hypothetical protein AB9K41_00595, partial [Cribrihabitans sp. XS_ASV171]
LTLGTLTATGDSDFAITQPSSTVLAAGSSTTFQVTFDPSAAGLRSATISIPNDDADEAPYDFTVTGSGRAAGGGTTLAAGDIGFTGFNTLDTDAFTFVLLKNIAAGTSIKFTDGGWTGTTFRQSEGMLEWIAPTAMSAGEVVKIDFTNLADDPSTTAQTDGYFSSSFSMSTAGDQIIAYQGTANASGSASTNIAAIHYDNNVFDSTFSDVSGSSLVPAGLTDGTNAISLGRGNASLLGAETE